MPIISHIIVALALSFWIIIIVPHFDKSCVKAQVPDGTMFTMAVLRSEVCDGSGWYLHDLSLVPPSDLLYLNIAGWEDVVACCFYKDFISLRDLPGSTRRW